MLAKDPAQRPDLDTVADELSQLGDDLTQPHPLRAAHSGPRNDAKTVAVSRALPRLPVAPLPAPGPERSARPRSVRRLVVGAAAVLIVACGVLVAAVVAPGDGGPPVPVTAGVPVVELARPAPLGALATRLSWSGTPGLRYTLVVTRPGEQPREEPAGDATTLTVATEPGSAYCFQVRGTDGRQVVESNVQRLRDAVC
jgi:hypothetical protein